jgi:hypothetical protein
LQATGVTFVVISPDDADALRAQHLPCRVIADPAGRILALLGQERRWYRFGRLPALLAVRPDGTLAGRYQGRTMADLPNLDDAIAWLKGSPSS